MIIISNDPDGEDGDESAYDMMMVFLSDVDSEKINLPLLVYTKL